MSIKNWAAKASNFAGNSASRIKNHSEDAGLSRVFLQKCIQVGILEVVIRNLAINFAGFDSSCF